MKTPRSRAGGLVLALCALCGPALAAERPNILFLIADDLGYALTLNTDLKALVVHGYHDLSTPYFMSRYLLEQSVYGDNARQRLSCGVYPGGHMFYLNPASRAELFKDVAAFYR